MRHVVLLLLWALAAPVLAVTDQAGQPEEPTSIEGRVLNAVTGEPVAKASLLLMRTDSAQAFDNWAHSYAAASDVTGKFAIRNVEPGKYRLRASRNGFVTLEYGARASRRSGTVLDLDRAQQLRNVELRLTPQGVIAGRVLDADGEPLAGAQVQLLRSIYVNGKKALSTTNTASTNDLGEYRFAGLTPGKYSIYAENVEASPPGSVAKEEYVPAYYPGATHIAGAIPVEVNAGAQVRAADMMLRKAPTATVKGRVVIELPGAQGTASVRFSPQVGHNNTAAGTFRSLPAKVNAAGAFEIRSLTPGTYTVMAEIAKGGRSFTGRATVEVAGTNLDGVVIAIGSGVSMTGRIRVDGEASLGNQNPSVRLQPGGPTVSAPGWTYRIAQDRTFKIENLDADRYGVLIDGLPDGFYTKSVRLGDADVTYSGVDLTSGAPGQLEILVSPKAGLVSGATQNPNTNQPAPGATVVLVPKEKERMAVFALYQQATTDQHGRFTFKNVVPGEYRVYAWEDVEASAWMDPEFMKPLEARGESITVEESNNAIVQVTLIPADSEK